MLLPQKIAFKHSLNNTLSIKEHIFLYGKNKVIQK